MEYREFPPSPALRPYVDCFWMHAGLLPTGGYSYSCAPSGNTDLMFGTTDFQEWFQKDDQWTEVPTACVNGLWTKPAFIRTGRHMGWFGIRLKPEVFVQLFNQPLRELENITSEVRSVLGRSADELAAQIIEAADTTARIALAEAFLLRELSRRLPRPGYWSEAMSLIRRHGGALSTDDLSRQVFVSKRQLQRAFQEYFGLSPKLYSRIVRFNRANHLIKTMPGLSWTHLTYDCGYADQAHFIREFREFTGASPAALVADPAALMALPATIE